MIYVDGARRRTHQGGSWVAGSTGTRRATVTGYLQPSTATRSRGGRRAGGGGAAKPTAKFQPKGKEIGFSFIQIFLN
jgi:hypothetical protein